MCVREIWYHTTWSRMIARKIFNTFNASPKQQRSSHNYNFRYKFDARSASLCAAPFGTPVTLKNESILSTAPFPFPPLTTTTIIKSSSSKEQMFITAHRGNFVHFKKKNNNNSGRGGAAVAANNSNSNSNSDKNNSNKKNSNKVSIEKLIQKRKENNFRGDSRTTSEEEIHQQLQRKEREYFRRRQGRYYDLSLRLWVNKQPHDHYLHQMYEKLDRDIERLVVSKDEEKKEKHVKYVTDWLTALAKVPVERYLPAGLYLRGGGVHVPEDVKRQVDLNAFYGDKLITSVLLDKIRKADGKYGANRAPRNKMEANNFLSACVRNKTFAELAPDILPDVKITAEEWRHHEHVAGTAVEAAIIAVADLSNDTLRQAQKDVAIDAVANLILEEGMKFAKSDVKPARAKFNDTLCLYTVKLLSRSVTGLVHDPKFIGTARVTHRRLYLGDQKKRYKNVPLEFGTIEVEAEGTSSDNAKEAASVQILELMKKLGLVDEEYQAIYVTDIKPALNLWKEHRRNEGKKKKEDGVKEDYEEDDDAREKQRRKM